MASIHDDLEGVAKDPVTAHPGVVQASKQDDTAMHATLSEDMPHPSSDSSTGSGSDEDGGHRRRNARPQLDDRKSSGTMIVPRDSSNIERHDEIYDDADARTMSPRRTSLEIEQMSAEARQSILEQARQLQASLLEVVEKVETVKTEHEKLEGGNRFLQSYIGELMQTSKITASGAAKKKGKARGAK